MPPHDRALAFLLMARKDFLALQAMTDAHHFSGEIFGFHAQQAVEKSLKALVAAIGGTPPITHNLILLLTMLEDAGVDVEDWWDLVELNAYAVQYRYEQLDAADEDIDRDSIIKQVGALLEFISTQIPSARNGE